MRKWSRNTAPDLIFVVKEKRKKNEIIQAGRHSYAATNTHRYVNIHACSRKWVLEMVQNLIIKII